MKPNLEISYCNLSMDFIGGSLSIGWKKEVFIGVFFSCAQF
jgi:hypothetical protein